MDEVETAFAGISRQAELIAAGELSSRELVELYLRRSARLNPLLNAYRVIFAERALLEAGQADARRAAGDRRPLLGVPIAVKDDLEVAGEVTALGTNAYGAPATADAELVRRLREAGAVIFAKTNVPELCLWPFTETATWGVTRNPWERQHTPGGSSGGSAAAVAAGLIGAALGSDGGGSIRLPAAYCGLFGLKAQRDRVPMAPGEGRWHGLAVAGVLTRSVRDSALFYDAIRDDSDAPSAAGESLPATPAGAFIAATGPAGLQGRLRIAVSTRLPPSPLTRLPPSPLTRLHEHNRAAVQETAELLRGLGHTVVEREVEHGPLAPPPEFVARYMSAASEEAAALANPGRLERRTRAIARLGGLLPSAAVDWARTREPAVAERLGGGLSDHDVLITPVTPAPPPPIGSCEGRGWLATTTIAAATVAYLAHWNYTGQPACSVPAGLIEGLPRAVQLIGGPGAETTLLALAAQIEAERPWAQRRPALFS